MLMDIDYCHFFVHANNATVNILLHRALEYMQVLLKRRFLEGDLLGQSVRTLLKSPPKNCTNFHSHQWSSALDINKDSAMFLHFFPLQAFTRNYQ